MKEQLFIEIFGYIGSALVVVSMLMSSIVKLRIINTVGSVISGVYAVICGAIPLAVMNVCLIAINGINLVKLFRSERVFEVVPGFVSDPMTVHFLEYFEEDIKNYFPDYDREATEDMLAYTVLCDNETAGVMLATLKDGELSAMIDYSTPKYRDCSVGRNLYSYLAAHSIGRIRFSGKPSDAHIAYMRKVGFENENGVYVKRLGDTI